MARLRPETGARLRTATSGGFVRSHGAPVREESIVTKNNNFLSRDFTPILCGAALAAFASTASAEGPQGYAGAFYLASHGFGGNAGVTDLLDQELGDLGG